MAVTYDSGTNTITVTGTATFADIQAANDSGGWGVCSTVGRSVKIMANLRIGDGATSTTLSDTGVTYQNGDANNQFQWTVEANATFSLTDFLLLDHTVNNYGIIYGVVQFKDGVWMGVPAWQNNCWLYGGYSFDNVTITGVVFVQQSTGSMNRCTVSETGFYVFTDTSTFNDIKTTSPMFIDAGINPTVTNSFIDSWAVVSLYIPNSDSYCDVTLIDCESTTWAVSYDSTSQGDYIVRRKYSMVTFVTDTAGAPVQGAMAALLDASRTIVFNETTDANGTYPSKVIQRGYYTKATGNTEQSNNPYIYVVRKYGKVFIETNFNVVDKVKQGTIVYDNPAITEADPAVVAAYADIQVDDATRRITLQADTTKARIYDYTQYAATQSPIYHEPIKSYTGRLFKLLSGYALDLNGFAVSDRMYLSSDGTTAPNGFLVTTSGSTISNISFSDYAGLHAIRVPATTTTLTLSDVAFDGSGVDVYWEGTSGTLVVEAVNGTVVNATASAGGAVEVRVVRTLTLTGLQPGSEVRIYRASDMAELGGVENVTGTSFTLQYNYGGSDVDVIVVVFALGYAPVRIPTTLTANDSTLPIQQQTDRTYKNP